MSQLAKSIVLPAACMLLACFSSISPSGEWRGHWLTNDGHMKRDPVFQKNGTEIVFTLESPVTGGMELVKLDLKQNKISKLLSDQQPGNREYSISLNQKVFAYNVVRGLSSKIHVVHTDSGKKLTVPQMGKANWNNWPSLSPDGTKLVFVEGAHTIFEFDVRGAGGKAAVRPLSVDGAQYSDYWPRYAPDGRTIIFASNRDSDFEIYRMNADGTNQHRITNSPGIDMHPVYSPDGKQIAFTSNRNGNHDVFVMDLASRTSIQLTTNPERDDFPIWHPNGKTLVVVSEHGGSFDLRRLTVELK